MVSYFQKLVARLLDNGLFLNNPFLMGKMQQYYTSQLIQKNNNQVSLGHESKLYEDAKVFNIQNDRNKIKIGDRTHIRGELVLYGHGGQIVIGDDCFVGKNSFIWSSSEIKIGDRVLIAHGVNIHDNISHPIDKEKRHQHFRSIIQSGHPTSGLNLKEASINIEDDVWIGFNVIIMRGVSIGKGAIIGAGSLVNTDIPPNSIAVGNPAKVIKTLA